jgi:hypothetical protein
MSRTKKWQFAALMAILFFGISTFFLLNNTKEDFEAENEERPDDPVLSGEEKAMFLDYVLSRQDDPQLKSQAADDGKSTYANGRVSGTWKQKELLTGWHGYRVENSAYDSLQNVFYVVSYAGHLYRLDYAHEVKWTLLNHKIQLNPPDNGSANPIFAGLHLPDSTFRLIRSHDEANRMEYSDDEGRNWEIATGAKVSRSWSNQAYVINKGNEKQVILHTYDANYHHLYVSDDYGKSYKKSVLSFPIATYDVRIIKPYRRDEVFMWVWGKNTKKIDIYEYAAEAGDFNKTGSSSSTVAGTNLSNVAGSWIDGNYHFYLSTINPDYTVYYSNDKGQTWVQKNSGRDRPFEIMGSDKPNVLISGFEDMKLSTNYGASWTGFDHKLGWDLQHMRSYPTKDGSFITLAGLDFGCYISKTPEDKNSYTWCNNGASYAMHYDAISSENFSSMYLANQDRGTTAYVDSANTVNTKDIDGTDVLRVALANHETSVWSWFYYGRIKHRFNFAGGKSGEAVYDGLGNWWAAPIIASPNPAEDAIYAAYGSNLQIFSYDAASNSISKSSHPFDFKAKFGGELGGFSYSELNRKLWYATLTNGLFFYSKDAGQTWTKSAYIGLTPKANDQSYNYHKNQIVIKASEIDTNKVYYAGVGNYLLISENAGKTFTIKNKGLKIYRIRDIALSPDEKFIFAACGYGGAWVFSVDNDQWYQMNDDPIPSVDFTDVQFIKKKNCVRFATYGSGIHDFYIDQQFNPLSPPDGLSLSLNNNNHVVLKWNNPAGDHQGFYVERASDGDFVRIASLAAGETSFTDTDVKYSQTCYYRVKAFSDETLSFASNLVYVTLPEEGMLNPANWSIVDFSSEEVNGEHAPARYAIDNNTATFWHTEWQNNKPGHPHYLSIDLGSESSVAGFRYLPRQDGNTNGQVAAYEMHVSNDYNSWGNPVAKGTLPSGAGWKEVIFDQLATGRYVKFTALSEINGSIYTSMAELALLNQVPLPETPIGVSASSLNDSTIMLRWTDNSDNESGFIIEQQIDDIFVSIDTIQRNKTGYIHTGLADSSTYTYRVRAYNRGGASEPSEIVEATTPLKVGVGEQEFNWNLYPNPFTDHFTLQLPGNKENLSLNVSDQNGRIVISQKLSEMQGQVRIETQELPAGLYIVEISGEKLHFSRKIIKK